MLNIHRSIYATVLLFSMTLLSGQKINGSFYKFDPISYMEYVQSIPSQDPEVNVDTVNENAIVIPAESVMAKKKSVTTALMWSIGTPIVGSVIFFGSASLVSRSSGANAPWELPALGVASLVIGPSTGHLYAGNVKRAILFSSLRVLVPALGFAVGVGLIAGSAGSTSDYDRGMMVGFAALALGYMVAAGSAAIVFIVDWINVPKSVREYNARLQVMPKIDLKTNSFGMGFTYRF